MAWSSYRDGPPEPGESVQERERQLAEEAAAQPSGPAVVDPPVYNYPDPEAPPKPGTETHTDLRPRTHAERNQ